MTGLSDLRQELAWCFPCFDSWFLRQPSKPQGSKQINLCEEVEVFKPCHLRKSESMTGGPAGLGQHNWEVVTTPRRKILSSASCLNTWAWAITWATPPLTCQEPMRARLGGPVLVGQWSEKAWQSSELQAGLPRTGTMIPCTPRFWAQPWKMCTWQCPVSQQVWGRGWSAPPAFSEV